MNPAACFDCPAELRRRACYPLAEPGAGGRSRRWQRAAIEIDEEFDVEILVNTPIVGRPSAPLQVGSLENPLGE